MSHRTSRSVPCAVSHDSGKPGYCTIHSPVMSCCALCPVLVDGSVEESVSSKLKTDKAFQFLVVFVFSRSVILNSVVETEGNLDSLKKLPEI